MKLVHGTQVKEVMHALQPRHIAVAYVGADWQSFVDISALEEIVVSPTVGSSADAIAELVGRLGWENVHFLNELHAKLYLGSTCAAIGSFNLTANGLSGHALAEAGYVVDGPAELEALRALYADLKAHATRQYDLQSKKEKRLSWLKDINSRLRTAGLDGAAPSRARTLAQYEPLTDTDFYCAFYEERGLELNLPALRKQDPDRFQSMNTDPEEMIGRQLPFLPRDEVLRGHWVLLWKAWTDERIPSSLEAEWMYINGVYPNGALGKGHGYTKLAVQWKGARGIGAPPFKLGRAEKKALTVLLESDTFPEFLPHPEGKSWSLNRTFPRFKAFVAEWKRLAGQ